MRNVENLSPSATIPHEIPSEFMEDASKEAAKKAMGTRVRRKLELAETRKEIGHSLAFESIERAFKGARNAEELPTGPAGSDRPEDADAVSAIDIAYAEIKRIRATKYDEYWDLCCDLSRVSSVVRCARRSLTETDSAYYRFTGLVVDTISAMIELLEIAYREEVAA